MQACGLVPVVEMKPVLLKPEGDRRCQVVINGQARFRMTTSEYSHYREEVWPQVVPGYEQLAEQYELILIEGAADAAEVNLRDRDIVNWAVAKLTNVPVLIVVH